MARCQTTSCARVNFFQRASMPPVSRALLALRYLTILPMSRRCHAGLEDLGRAAPWFPVVGTALGLVLAAVDAGTGRVFPPLLAALLTVTVWKLLTGGLHLDGLADCLDGLSGRDPATRLAIMSDSRIGTFGAIGLILFLMLELAAVSELPPGTRWRTLVAAPAIARRFIGHLDVPLSARGEAQCVAQARRLAGASIAALYTSDLGRARRSGEIIGAPHGLTPTLVPDLREMAMGRWEGLTADEIRAREPEAFADWMGRIGEFPFPEGESVPDLLARAGPAFDAIVAGAPGRAIAIVAHGGTNRALLCRALGLPLGRLLALGQDSGALSVLERDGDGWALHRLNEGPMTQ